MKILVTTICFIQSHKLEMGSEMYATFANRLIDSTMENSNFDIRVATNRPDLFSDALDKYGDRVSLLVDMLEDKRVAVGAFNQLLKFLALKDIPTEYDYVLYLDCDAGFFQNVNYQLLNQTVQHIESEGFNGLVNRAYTTYLMDCLKENDAGIGNMFSAKFYLHKLTSTNIPEEWKDATLPCEHILFLKNEGNRLQIMSDKIAEFNKVLEAQDIETGYVACSPDMEAFELGIGARVAGYKFAELTGYVHHDVLGVKFNGSNWEGLKL